MRDGMGAPRMATYSYFTSFSQPNGPPGDGWTEVLFSPPAELDVINGVLTLVGSGPAAAIYRPINIPSPSVEVTATFNANPAGYLYNLISFGGNGSPSTGNGVALFANPGFSDAL